MHFYAAFGIVGYVLVNVATAASFAILVWAVYLALEPFVRRYWPRTLISWTRILGGRIRDGAVGRDILIGAAVSCLWRIMSDVYGLLSGSHEMPDLPSEDLIISARGVLREVLENPPHAVRDTMAFFFLIFLLRILLRKEWLAAVAFTLLFTLLAAGSGSPPAEIVFTAVVYGSFSFVTVRFGLLALASLVLVDGTLGDIPATFDTSAWFYPYFVSAILAVSALIVWAFWQSVGGKARLSPGRLFRL
jgi:serine/threonine-protein kinase